MKLTYSKNLSNSLIFTLLLLPITVIAADYGEKSALAFCVKCANSALEISRYSMDYTLPEFINIINESNMTELDKMLNISIGTEVYTIVKPDMSPTDTSQLIFDRCMDQFKIKKMVPADDPEVPELTL